MKTVKMSNSENLIGTLVRYGEQVGKGIVRVKGQGKAAERAALASEAGEGKSTAPKDIKKVGFVKKARDEIKSTRRTSKKPG